MSPVTSFIHSFELLKSTVVLMQVKIRYDFKKPEENNPGQFKY